MPILCAFAGVGVAIVFGLVWPTVGGWFFHFGQWLVGSGWIGAGIFGVVVRALIPIGMHHFFSFFPWFEAGSFTNTHTGEVVHGDIARFLAGDPTAGQFMTGGFPIYHCAKPHRRKEITGMMISAALTSFITGVTEPIEFAFLFVAPVLYAIHALLFGVSMALTYALGIRDGFGFCAARRIALRAADGCHSADVVAAGASRATAEEAAALLREVVRMPATAAVTRNYLHGEMESAGDTLHVVLGDDREVEPARTLAAAGHPTQLVTTADVAPSGPLHVARLPETAPGPRVVREMTVLQELCADLADARDVPIESFVFANHDTRQGGVDPADFSLAAPAAN